MTTLPRSGRVLPAFLAAIWFATVSGCVRPAGHAGGSEEVFPTTQPARWWKGDLHLHSKWSDGNQYPDVVADWYKQQGYHFVSLTDHNILQDRIRWVGVDRTKGGAKALAEYQKRFGDTWVELREENGQRMARLKTLKEIRPLVEEPNRFCLIAGEEVSDALDHNPIHFCAINITEIILPPRPTPGKTAADVIRRNVDAVSAQQAKGRRPMLVQLNHPDFGRGLSVDDVIKVPDLRFMEIGNGGIVYPVIEQAWDEILVRRLSKPGGQVLYGVLTDDAEVIDPSRPNEGEWATGWVVVRAVRLSPDSIVAAMLAGDFYASTGVQLKDIRYDGRRITIEVQAEDGAVYSTQFIGTRRGRPVAEVLSEVTGASPSYSMVGNEMYVRAKVISSRKKESHARGQTMAAYTQPFVPKAK